MSTCASSTTCGEVSIPEGHLQVCHACDEDWTHTHTLSLSLSLSHTHTHTHTHSNASNAMAQGPTHVKELVLLDQESVMLT